LLHLVSFSSSSLVVLAHRDSGHTAHSFRGEPPDLAKPGRIAPDEI
jgi:hypothetical protein